MWYSKLLFEKCWIPPILITVESIALVHLDCIHQNETRVCVHDAPFVKNQELIKASKKSRYVPMTNYSETVHLTA